MTYMFIVKCALKLVEEIILLTTVQLTGNLENNRTGEHFLCVHGYLNYLYERWKIYKVSLVTVMQDHHKYLEPHSTLVGQFQNSRWLNHTCFLMIMCTLLVALLKN